MTLLLVDGTNLQHRSTYAGTRTPMTRVDGRECGAAIAFCITLGEICHRYRPTRLSVVFDGPGKTFRRVLSEQYKGMREKREPDASVDWQVAAMKHACRIIGGSVVRSGVLEADDVIATMCVRAQPRMPVVIASDDKDANYLTHLRGVTIHQFRDNQQIGAAHAQQRWGVRPDRIPQLQSMGGDAGDGAHGLRGMGKVKARQVVEQYGWSSERALMRVPEWGGKRWMEHAAACTGIRVMRDAVRAVSDADVPMRAGRPHADWRVRLGGVLLALGSRQYLKSYCTTHGIQMQRLRPDEHLSPVNMDLGVDPLPRGLFG